MHLHPLIDNSVHEDGATYKNIKINIKSIIRSPIEYACQVWHGGLSETQRKDLERIQKRALQIIFPDYHYQKAMEESRLESLHERREYLSRKLFQNIMKDETHKLHYLIKGKKKTYNYNLRGGETYTFPQVTVDRFKNTFVNYGLFNLQ